MRKIFMKLAYYSEKKLKKEIKEIIGKYLNLKKYKIFFFGSRVKGDNFERADIDIGIEGPKSVPIEIMGEIEDMVFAIPTLYKIDVVDFKMVSNKFKEEALKNVQYIK